MIEEEILIYVRGMDSRSKVHVIDDGKTKPRCGARLVTFAERDTSVKLMSKAERSSVLFFQCKECFAR